MASKKPQFLRGRAMKALTLLTAKAIHDAECIVDFASMPKRYQRLLERQAHYTLRDLEAAGALRLDWVPPVKTGHDQRTPSHSGAPATPGGGA